MPRIAEIQPTLLSVVWPENNISIPYRLLRTLIMALLGSLFIALLAQVQVPIWPVPITGQTFGVLVVGMAFGFRLGGLTLLLYLLEGYLGPGSQYVAAIGASTAIGAALTKGLLPFIIGDILKLALAAIIFPYVWRLLPRFK